MVKINIKMFFREFSLEVDLNDTSENIKQKIHDKEGIPVVHRLIFEGKFLEDGKTLKQYGIKENSSLVIVINTRGD